jgi:hypothetical protein
MKTLAEKGKITGRYADLHPNTNPLTPTVGEAALLNYHTPGNEEVSDTGVRTRKYPLKDAPKKLTPSQMLYMHQEFGSSDRQRGVSATTTAKPLFANAGEGFAGDDAEAMKLVLDLSKVPRHKRGRAPQLANLHHQIPGMKRAVNAPDTYKTEWKGKKQAFPKKPTIKNQRNLDDYNDRMEKFRASHDKNIRSSNEIERTSTANQAHIDWSTSKNREIFIRSVNQKQVSKVEKPLDEERFKPPSK